MSNDDHAKNRNNGLSQVASVTEAALIDAGRALGHTIDDHDKAIRRWLTKNSGVPADMLHATKTRKDAWDKSPAEIISDVQRVYQKTQDLKVEGANLAKDLKARMEAHRVVGQFEMASSMLKVLREAEALAKLGEELERIVRPYFNTKERNDGSGT